METIRETPRGYRTKTVPYEEDKDCSLRGRQRLFLKRKTKTVPYEDVLV